MNMPEGPYNRPPERPPEPPRKGITMADIERFIMSKHGEPGWDDSARALEWARGRNDASIIMPFFENECARASLDHAGKKELRRMVCFLDQQARLQRDLPKTAIIGILKQRAFDQKITSLTGRQDKEYVDDEAQSWAEDIEQYAKYDNIESALHRIEGMVREANAAVDSAAFVRPKDLKENAARRIKLAELNKKLGRIRAARATLLEKYFAPDSMH